MTGHLLLTQALARFAEELCWDFRILQGLYFRAVYVLQCLGFLGLVCKNAFTCEIVFGKTYMTVGECNSFTMLESKLG